MLEQLTKIALVLSACLTILMAFLIIGHIAFYNGDDLAWNVVRQVCALIVISVGGLTLAAIRNASPKASMQSHLLIIGAIVLVAVGAFGTAWGIHLGETTGDFEYWAIMLNMIIAGQGALTIWHIWRKMSMLTANI